MAVVLTHPTGNEFFRAAAGGFYDSGQLQSLYTPLASFPGSFLYTLGAWKWFADIRRRSYDRKFKGLVHIHAWKETGRLLALKAGNKKLTQHETGIFSVDAVYKDLDRFVAKNLAAEKQKGASSVYAYEDGAAYSFEKAKELGMACLYDLPIGYWRTMHEVLAAEKSANPAWGFTLGGLKDSPAKLERKDTEIALADKIFVASTFTAGTLEAYPGKLPPVYVIPYGFPAAAPKAYRGFERDQRLKILFVGGLSQRKGLSYLFDAVNGLGKHVSLTVVGRGANIGSPLKENLARHTWIESLPHAGILALMRRHDLLVFPSLFEGFGQVITEAMAQGTPVITTGRTAGPDIISHGENGWLVNAGSAEAIKFLLEKLLFRPQLIAEVGEQAVITAAKRPWSVYGKELAAAVSENKRALAH